MVGVLCGGWVSFLLCLGVLEGLWSGYVYSVIHNLEVGKWDSICMFLGVWDGLYDMKFILVAKGLPC